MAGSPIDETAWPEQLTAHVVAPGDDPRIHGYAVQADLAPHYTFPEVALLSLTGEPPSKEAGAAFSTALVWLSPVSIAEAPSHAAVLAKICGGRHAQVVSTGVVGLAEQARFVLDAHASLLSWLSDPGTGFPADARCSDDAEKRAVRVFAHSLPTSYQRLDVFDNEPTLIAALIAVLHSAGLTNAAQLETAWTFARLPVMAAESMAAEPGDYRNYPTNVPTYVYQEERDEKA